MDRRSLKLVAGDDPEGEVSVSANDMLLPAQLGTFRDLQNHGGSDVGSRFKSARCGVVHAVESSHPNMLHLCARACTDVCQCACSWW